MTTKTARILIVDDDPDYLAQMEFQVNRMGYEVIRAESEKEGREVLGGTKPDLAIFDLMMENSDSGFILSHQAKDLYPDLPVILATAVTSETGMVFGVDAEEDRKWIKADLYLEKGIRPDQLHAEISKLLKNQNNPQEPEQWKD
jgi:DNA-binding response OmpR family regulator